MERGEMSELKMEAKEYGLKLVKPTVPKKPMVKKAKVMKTPKKPKLSKKKK